MEGTRAIGYVYVAHGAKADLAEQAAAIRRCCHARGLQLQAVVHDVAHPETGHHRPSLLRALEQVAGGHVDALVVARLRIWRSTPPTCDRCSAGSTTSIGP